MFFNLSNTQMLSKTAFISNFFFYVFYNKKRISKFSQDAMLFLTDQTNDQSWQIKTQEY